MKEHLEELFKYDRQLLGKGYHDALYKIHEHLPLDVFCIASGTQFSQWTVPNEWSVREAWVKYKGEKVIDFANNPLTVTSYSLPFIGTVDLSELKKHLYFSEERPGSVPYSFKFYDRDWGLGAPKALIDSLEEGEYEIFIDVDEKPGVMELGIHTIWGKSDREILLFAHLDHPFQANDNLSAVVCLMDLAKKLQLDPNKKDHTVKIVFCPETIGSIAYAHTQDLSKVDFMIAVDICGNDHALLLQKSFDPEDRLNRVAHCALQVIGKTYRKAMFRNTIGSDEYVFNDPKLKIPGLMLTRHPYAEYHSSEDTPDRINYERIEDTQEVILKIIEIYEKDFIPERVGIGPMMRSKYNIQTPSPQVNLNLDYLWYSLSGERTVAEWCCEYELNFDWIYGILTEMEKNGEIRRVDSSQGAKQSPTRKKQKRVLR